MLRAFLIFIGCVVPLFSHGLQISTAGIVLRHGNHLSLSLRYNPIEVLHERDGHLEPAALANMSDAGFKQKYKELKTLLQSGLIIHVGESAIESPHFRFSSEKAFKEQLRNAFMQQMLPDAHHDDHDHMPTLTVRLDGFIPKNSHGELRVRFPKEIGEVMVSFSTPVTQTLSPDKNGSLFSLPLRPKKVTP